MSDTTLDPALERQLAELRAQGCRIVGPGPMTQGETPPAEGTTAATPGVHVQIVRGHRMVEGLGGTADEAVRDALGKLTEYDPTERTQPR